MQFSVFLKERKEQLGFHTVQELYDHYGGGARLEVSFRQFQNIESGKTPPSADLLAKVFDKEPVAHHQPIIQAFFESHLSNKTYAAGLLKYVSKHLTHALEEGSYSWDAVEYRPYSESQLSFFLDNPEAMRFHHKLMLYERLPKKEITISERQILEMEKLELIERDLKQIRPSIKRYRLPRYGAAGPRLVARAHQMIFKHVELYASLEGSEKQEVAYALQFVDKTIAKAARLQLRSLKEWVQSHVSLKDPTKDPNLVPMVFVGFCKELEDKEI